MNEGVLMKKLKRTVVNNNSSITVNFKSFESNIWVLRSIEFKQETEATKFLNQIEKDFTKRLVSVEKRTLLYEKYVK